ncbi:hypothetical protein [Caulobacter sp. NIBR1757]|uniref:hypothetical protein n=1 Tax=Caulobacter sp. NIBR1757 TaxID=3016000 RepID=UPI0022F06F66|nr:hypothetical protein [Caulobacter sp. NIBR1757]WGM38859.1 hypothetical protein AMEJIAPC_01766 [Caulobacter sp. NIBR1757]
MTPDKAVSRGVLVVNGSVMLVMFGLPSLVYAAVLLLGVDSSSAATVAVLAFMVCWPLAWLTWSLLVPRWRLWAYSRVEDIDELKAYGVAAGLIWREGHLFERTEIRTPDQRRRLRELEQAWAARRP